MHSTPSQYQTSREVGSSEHREEDGEEEEEHEAQREQLKLVRQGFW